MRIMKVMFPCSLVIFSTLTFAATNNRIPGAVATGQTVALRGNVHRNAVARFDRGPADPNLRFGSMMLETHPTAAQQNEIRQLLADQQNPKSRNFHKWITPEQWADRFGLSAADVAKITGWLKSQGFSNIHVARARNWVSFAGTAAQVQSAFKTQIHKYFVNGEMHVANATSPRIPAALSGVVTQVAGLTDFHLKPRKGKRVRPYYADSTFGNVMAPGDIAKMYDLNSAFDGTGQNIAVIGQSDVYLDDINDFRTGFGLSSLTCATGTNSLITSCADAHFTYELDPNVSDPGVPTSGDLAEADLDIEWASAIAPGANIFYVNAPAVFNSGGSLVSGGVWRAWYYAVDQNFAPVISMSYGNCEFNFPYSVDGSDGGTDETELQLANSEGITFVNSTGDTGPAGCDLQFPQNGNNGNLAEFGLAVGYPASSPEVTAVGGSAISIGNLASSTYWGTSNAATGGNVLSYVPEVPWNDDVEVGEACSVSSPPSFCTNNGITDAVSAQAFLGLSASGGGPSNCATQTPSLTSCAAGFPQPTWQQNLTVSGQQSGASGVRMIPDVSLLASPNFPGYIFCTQASELGATGTGSVCAPGGANGITNALAAVDSQGNPTPAIIGGTSVSAPIFAGMVALMNQYLGSAGQGNINQFLYQAAGTPGTFNQITTGNNLIYCDPGTPTDMPSGLQCPALAGGAANSQIGFDASTGDPTTGYNLVTGLGSVDWNNLAPAMASVQLFSLAPTAASYAVTQGQSVDATVQVTFQPSFTGTVTFTCSDSVSESTCTAPAAATASGQVSSHITTTAASASLHRPFDRGSRIFYAVLLPGLMGLVFVAGSRKRSLQGLRILGLVMVLGASTTWLASCGGSNNSSGGGNPGTPKGSHNIAITGASGNVTLSQTIVINVQ
jgi:subtilase family serine protease